jgi:hypothetical protein
VSVGCVFIEKFHRKSGSSRELLGIFDVENEIEIEKLLN